MDIFRQLFQEEGYENTRTWAVFKSKADNNYKPKGHRQLSEFTKMPLTKTLIKRFKGEGKLVKYMRDQNPDSPEDKCIVWVDKGKYVCSVTYDTNFDDDHHKWISGIDVGYKYRGLGLGEQMVRLAMKDGVNALDVQIDNEVAIAMYKKLGFKISDESKKKVESGKSKWYQMFHK